MSLTRFRIHQYMHPFTQKPVLQTRRTEHFGNKQGDSTKLEKSPRTSNVFYRSHKHSQALPLCSASISPNCRGHTTTPQSLRTTRHSHRPCLRRLNSPLRPFTAHGNRAHHQSHLPRPANIQARATRCKRPLERFPSPMSRRHGNTATVPVQRAEPRELDMSTARLRIPQLHQEQHPLRCSVHGLSALWLESLGSAQCRSWACTCSWR